MKKGSMRRQGSGKVTRASAPLKSILVKNRSTRRGGSTMGGSMRSISGSRKGSHRALGLSASIRGTKRSNRTTAKTGKSAYFRALTHSMHEVVK